MIPTRPVGGPYKRSSVVSASSHGSVQLRGPGRVTPSSNGSGMYYPAPPPGQSGKQYRTGRQYKGTTPPPAAGGPHRVSKQPRKTKKAAPNYATMYTPDYQEDPLPPLAAAHPAGGVRSYTSSATPTSNSGHSIHVTPPPVLPKLPEYPTAVASVPTNPQNQRQVMRYGGVPPLQNPKPAPLMDPQKLLEYPGEAEAKRQMERIQQFEASVRNLEYTEGSARLAISNTEALRRRDIRAQRKDTIQLSVQIQLHQLQEQEQYYRSAIQFSHSQSQHLLETTLGLPLTQMREYMGRQTVVEAELFTRITIEEYTLRKLMAEIEKIVRRDLVKKFYTVANEIAQLIEDKYKYNEMASAKVAIHKQWRSWTSRMDQQHQQAADEMDTFEANLEKQLDEINAWEDDSDEDVADPVFGKLDGPVVDLLKEQKKKDEAYYANQIMELELFEWRDRQGYVNDEESERRGLVADEKREHQFRLGGTSPMSAGGRSPASKSIPPQREYWMGGGGGSVTPVAAGGIGVLKRKVPSSQGKQGRDPDGTYGSDHWKRVETPAEEVQRLVSSLPPHPRPTGQHYFLALDPPPDPLPENAANYYINTLLGSPTSTQGGGRVAGYGSGPGSPAYSASGYPLGSEYGSAYGYGHSKHAQFHPTRPDLVGGGGIEPPVRYGSRLGRRAQSTAQTLAQKQWAEDMVMGWLEIKLRISQDDPECMWVLESIVTIQRWWKLRYLILMEERTRAALEQAQWDEAWHIGKLETREWGKYHREWENIVVGSIQRAWRCHQARAIYREKMHRAGPDCRAPLPKLPHEIMGYKRKLGGMRGDGTDPVTFGTMLAFAYAPLGSNILLYPQPEGYADHTTRAPRPPTADRVPTKVPAPPPGSTRDRGPSRTPPRDLFVSFLDSREPSRDTGRPNYYYTNPEDGPSPFPTEMYSTHMNYHPYEMEERDRYIDEGSSDNRGVTPSVASAAYYNAPPPAVYAQPPPPPADEEERREAYSQSVTPSDGGYDASGGEERRESRAESEEDPNWAAFSPVQTRQLSTDDHGFERKEATPHSMQDYPSQSNWSGTEEYRDSGPASAVQSPPGTGDKKDKSEDVAATRIQNTFRARAARRQVEERRKEKKQQTAAATRIQARYRGHKTRREHDLVRMKQQKIEDEWRAEREEGVREESVTPPNYDDERYAAAAVRIQKIQRGRQARKERRRRIQEKQDAEMRAERETGLADEEDDYAEGPSPHKPTYTDEQAAVRIQAGFRGMKGRKDYQNRKKQQNDGPVFYDLDGAPPEQQVPGERQEEEQAQQPQQQEEPNFDDMEPEERRTPSPSTPPKQRTPSPEIEVAERRTPTPEAATPGAQQTESDAPGMSDDAAAAKIQAGFRGRQGRKQADARRQEHKEQTEAATKIQAIQRGRMERKKRQAEGEAPGE